MSQLHPPQEQIRKLLAFVSQQQASDLHLKIGLPPYVRIGGHQHALETPPLPDSEYVERMMYEPRRVSDRAFGIGTAIRRVQGPVPDGPRLTGLISATRERPGPANCPVVDHRPGCRVDHDFAGSACHNGYFCCATGPNSLAAASGFRSYSR
jgi:hypothetical protein